MPSSYKWSNHFLNLVRREMDADLAQIDLVRHDTDMPILRRRSQPNGLWRAVTITLLILIIIAVTFAVILWNTLDLNLDGVDASLSEYLSALQLVLVVIAGGGGSVALVVAYRRQKVNERAELTERFTAASEQLGHDSPAVRMAGVHALATLVDDWDDHARRQMCIDVLCSYARMPDDSEPSTEDHPSGRAGWESAREVKRTILRVIAAHLRGIGGERVSWQGHKFDLSGTVIDVDLDFSLAEFDDNTTLNFGGATFAAGETSFGMARFLGSTFEPVSFDQAKLVGGAVSFIRAEFGSGVSFIGTEFDGATVAFNTRFPMGAIIGPAILKRGKLDFSGATFEDGANMSIVFAGGSADFSRATFLPSATTFNDTAFCGSTVTFNEANFFEEQRPAPQVGMFTNVSFAYADDESPGLVDFQRVKRWPGRVALGLLDSAPGLRLPKTPDEAFGPPAHPAMFAQAPTPQHRGLRRIAAKIEAMVAQQVRART